jgi:hypothetical protein
MASRSTLDVGSLRPVSISLALFVVNLSGYPRAFLIDIDSSRARLGEWKRDLFDRIKFCCVIIRVTIYILEVHCDENHAETDDSIIFGYQSAIFLQEVLGKLSLLLVFFILRSLCGESSSACTLSRMECRSWIDRFKVLLLAS